MRVRRAFVPPSAHHFSPALLAIAILVPGTAMSQMQVPNPERRVGSALGAKEDELRSSAIRVRPLVVKIEVSGLAEVAQSSSRKLTD